MLGIRFLLSLSDSLFLRLFLSFCHARLFRIKMGSVQSSNNDSHALDIPLLITRRFQRLGINVQVTEEVGEQAVDNTAGRNNGSNSNYNIHDPEDLQTAFVRVSSERDNVGPINSNSSHNNSNSDRDQEGLDPIVSRVAFPRVFLSNESATSTSSEASVDLSSFALPSTEAEAEDIVAYALQILFQRDPFLRRMHLISQLDSRDELYKAVEQRALSEMVEEAIAKADIYAPAA